MELLVLLLFLVAVDILGWFFGADSREPERIFPPDPDQGVPRSPEVVFPPDHERILTPDVPRVLARDP